VIYLLSDRFYGERGGRLRDPFGQQWMLSQRIEQVSPDEMNRRIGRPAGRSLNGIAPGEDALGDRD